MKYKITIDTIEDKTGEKYPSSQEIYQQVVDSLDVQKVIAVVNGIASSL